MSETFQSRYLKARRAVIEKDFSHLNDMQREAVLTTDGPLLLLAGAGSGKTTVLINRIANLMKYGSASDGIEIPEGVGERELAILENPEQNLELAQRLSAFEPCQPWRIIAITFTNKAADELKARLSNMLGEDAKDIWAQTFHSACVRILRRNAEKLGFSNSFTIYDTADSQSLMKRIIKELDLDDKLFNYKSVLSYISKAKDYMITPEQFYETASAGGDIKKKKIAELYMTYANRLRDANAFDFDDLILYTVKLLLEHEDVRAYYQKLFRYVLVDEYQDTNNLQYLLVSTLAGGYENICVVGDDDQSIYKFRGATIKNILDFEKQYEDAKVIRLEQNYRSTAPILNSANAVISNNKARKGKKLWTDKDGGERLTIYSAEDEFEEAQFVAQQIVQNVSEGDGFNSHAVLYRMNAQSNQLERAFQRAGIPYKIVGGTKFFDRAEIKDMISYLSVIINPTDETRLLRIINTPTRGIGASSVERALEIARQENRNLFEVFESAREYPELSRSAPRMVEFCRMIKSLRELSEEQSAEEVYNSLLEETGYVRKLREKGTDIDESRAENIEELKSNIISYARDTEDDSLAGFLDEVALYTDLDSLNRDDNAVTMMTMHAAKGLEFETVFIVGVEEGLFPGIRTIGEPDEIEEERRLCYVAMTRAKQKLYILCAKQRMLFGKTGANLASRFIAEIPEEYAERKGSFHRPPSQKSWSFEERETKSVSQFKPSGGFATNSAAALDFSVGDRVLHKAFGSGEIKKKTAMGGDFLVEIDFDGTLKKLMLKAASQHMTKE
ncbi:UvrD-helicase domain-containing protein [Clostridiaceae bacterium OttesenSCG-928-D20]|nr:UvrD-helicase domain-containing protein [Clostridiaceae bacterium OttesenSCG-928-D20]